MQLSNSPPRRKVLVRNSQLRRKVMRSRDVRQVQAQALYVLGTGSAWMESPNSRLGGQSPKQAVLSGNKSGVMAIIDSVRYGLFS